MPQQMAFTERDLSVHLEEVHRGLTVEIIATGSEDLVTCAVTESPCEVTARVYGLAGSRPEQPQYDFLPVTAEKTGSIVGFLQVELAQTGGSTTVGECPGFAPLTEDDLIGAGTSILHFIRSADDTPKPRLVVGDNGFLGLVNSADLVHPMVGMAIAVRILAFETKMNHEIEARFGGCRTWMERLERDALNRIDRWYNGLKQKNIEPDFEWMCGTIADKMCILGVDLESGQRIKQLRDAVFHTRPPSEVSAALGVLEETERWL